MLHASMASDFQKETMLSAGGKMVGKTWTEIPRGGTSWFDNDHFRMALLLRLGEVSIPQGA
eukprot:4319178-Karenia_brevis.AAC.1